MPEDFLRRPHDGTPVSTDAILFGTPGRPHGQLADGRAGQADGAAHATAIVALRCRWRPPSVSGAVLPGMIRISALPAFPRRRGTGVRSRPGRHQVVHIIRAEGRSQGQLIGSGRKGRSGIGLVPWRVRGGGDIEVSEAGRHGGDGPAGGTRDRKHLGAEDRGGTVILTKVRQRKLRPRTKWFTISTHSVDRRLQKRRMACRDNGGHRVHHRSRARMLGRRGTPSSSGWGRRREQADAIDGARREEKGAVQARPLTVKSMLFLPGKGVLPDRPGMPLCSLAHTRACRRRPMSRSGGKNGGGGWTGARVSGRSGWWQWERKGDMCQSLIRSGWRTRHAHRACEHRQCDGSMKPGPCAVMESVCLQAG